MRSLKKIIPSPPVWVFWLVAAATFAQLLRTYAGVYAPGFGITKLIVIGQEFDQRGLAPFRATPKYVGSFDRWGFDGQHYAQLALDPLLRDPQIKIALDSPPYRARRILLPWLAWLGGLGQPAWILNVYAALNLVFWAGFAVMMIALFRPHGWAGVAGLAAMLMTCGIIESMHASLTDFPALVLMTLAAMIGGGRGAGVLALAGLARETNLIGIVGLWHYRPPWRAALKRNLWLGLIAAGPMLLWFAYVAWRLRMTSSLDGSNLDWPLRGIIAQLGQFAGWATDGSIRWSRWYTELYSSDHLHALLTIIAVLTQCLYLLTHRDWDNRLWRVGILFVPFFLCVGLPAWESHFTVTRHALPVTLAFNLVLATRARRTWPIWFLLGNCFVPYGIHRFATADRLNPVAPAEILLLPPLPRGPAASLCFGSGWSGPEGSPRRSWRWATAQQAGVLLTNPGRQPLEAEVSFALQSLSPRDVAVIVRGTTVWAGPVTPALETAQTSRFLLPPGPTLVTFSTPQAPVSPQSGDTRKLSFRLRTLEVRLSAPPAEPGTGP